MAKSLTLAVKEAFDEALNWKNFCNDASDPECRFFCGENDIEKMFPNDYDSFIFTAGETDHNGATLIISKAPECESDLTINEVAEKVIQYYSGCLKWDNDGYGTKRPYVFMSATEELSEYFDEIHDEDPEFELTIRGIEFEVFGTPEIIEKTEDSATIHIAFEIKNMHEVH